LASFSDGIYRVELLYLHSSSSTSSSFKSDVPSLHFNTPTSFLRVQIIRRPYFLGHVPAYIHSDNAMSSRRSSMRRYAQSTNHRHCFSVKNRREELFRFSLAVGLAMLLLPKTELRRNINEVS
jgi:hypothetical protein